MNEHIVIYALLDPRTEEVCYVGKTTDIYRRFRRHCAEKGHTHRHNWIKQLWGLGFSPRLRVLEQTTPKEWQTRERWWIAFYRMKGASLTNISDGGNGASGVSPSEKTCRKISESVKRSWHDNPRTLSERHKRALIAGNKNKKRSLEWRGKVSRALEGRAKTALAIRRMADSKRGHAFGPQSIERRAKISIALQGERNGMAKLTRKKAKEIRRRYAVGGVSLRTLGDEYGVDAKQIHRIVRNKAWIAQ